MRAKPGIYRYQRESKSEFRELSNDVAVYTKVPYRRLRHPNDPVLGAVIVRLPPAFGAVAIAAAFSALDLAPIGRRMRIEERALAPPREL